MAASRLIRRFSDLLGKITQSQLPADGVPASQVTGLGGAAVLNVGTSAGTVAAGNDTRIVGAAQNADNLSSLASVTTARTNLGLGNSATRNIGSSTGTVAAGDDARLVTAAYAAGLNGIVVATGSGFRAATAGTDYLAPAGNGSSLTNLNASALSSGTVSIARIPTGSTSATVAIGNDSRITGAAQAANNLSDLASVSTARANLGLGSIATYSSSAYVATAGNASSTTCTASRTSEISRTLSVRLAETVNVKDFGAAGDGTTDDTNAIKAAIAVAGQTAEVYFPAGTYLVSDTLATNCQGFSWRGQKPERGGGVIGSQIKFRPSDTTKYLVVGYNLVNVTTYCGPYTSINMAYDLGDANGFQLGLRCPNFDGVEQTLVDQQTQGYVAGIRFERCRFNATSANRASDSSGHITRSGRYMLDFAKNFETVLKDSSFYGGDTQISFYGPDAPTIENCRSLWSHLPVLIRASGGFTVHARIRGLQVEGWTFTPIAVYNQSFAISDGRFECNVKVGGNVPTGMGALTLSQTAAVTAGSATLTFSADMSTILWPYITVISFTDNAGNTTLGYVTAVSGTSVTIDVSSTAITWSASAATVTRYTGVGPIINTIFGGGIQNCDLDSLSNCPCVVGVATRGQLSIQGARGIYSNTNTNAMVIGNLMTWTTTPSSGQNAGSHVSFSGCDPSVVADTNHPNVVCFDMRPGHGQADYDSNAKRNIGPLFEDMERTSRCWAFSPKSYGTYTASTYLTTWQKVAVDANSNQYVYAWVKNSSYPIVLNDETLPSVSTSLIRIRIRARMATGTGGVTYYFTGAGNNSGSGTYVALTATWTTYETVMPVPSYWAGATTDSYGKSLVLTGSGFYVAGVTVEEIPPNATGCFPGGIVAPNGGAITYQNANNPGLSVQFLPNPIAVSNASLTSNVATLTVPTGHGIPQYNYVTVSGINATFNGTFQVTSTTATTISYSKAASNVSSFAVTGQVVQLLPAGNYLSFLDAGGNHKLDFDQNGNVSGAKGTFSSDLSTGKHLLSTGSAPTIAAGAAAGTSPTVSITGNDVSGLITVTTGTSPATGILATITFNASYASAPKCPVIGPATSNFHGLGAYADPSGVTTSVWTIKVDSAPSASTTYKFTYHVTG